MQHQGPSEVFLYFSSFSWHVFCFCLCSACLPCFKVHAVSVKVWSNSKDGDGSLARHDSCEISLILWVLKKKLRETPKEAWVGVWKTCAIATISMYSLRHPGYRVCLSVWVDALQQCRLLSFEAELNEGQRSTMTPLYHRCEAVFCQALAVNKAWFQLSLGILTQCVYKPVLILLQAFKLCFCFSQGVFLSHTS